MFRNGTQEYIMNIYVGNLSYNVKDEDLRGIFGEFGEVSSARVMTDRFSGQHRGFGFVEMTSKSDAINAIQELNGREIDGRAIRVNEAKPQENRSGGGGGGRGRW